MVDRVGQQLGNYRLVQLLGQGGFAEVYLGEHIYLETQAAIKVLHTQLARDDIEKFRIEARTIAHLEHPHIVRVLEFGVEGSTPYLAMSYAPNGSLRHRHPRGTRLPIPTIISYIGQVAPALQYAHDQKLIHRDIKPENLLVGRSNEILLSDFGIALIAQSSHYQSTQDMVGTIAYMAPEQIEAHPRPASDQYSLGIVVYEWLSGDRPFQGTFTEIAIKHTIMPPPTLHEKIPGLSPDVEQVVMKALAKDPRQRFDSVQAFANALEEACQPTLLRPVTPSSTITLSSTQTLKDSPSSEPVISPPPHTQHIFPSSHTPSSPFSTIPLDPVPTQVVSPPSKSRLSPKTILLIGLVLLLVLGSTVGLIYSRGLFTNTPTAPNQSKLTASPQSSSTAVAGTTQTTSTGTIPALATLDATSSNPYPPNKGNLVVNHPLTSKTAGWGVSKKDPYCQFTGGAYHVRAGQTSECGYSSDPFTNYAYQIQVTFITSDVCGGIIFGIQQSLLAAYYDFEICTNGAYSLGKVNPIYSGLRGNSIDMNTDVGQANVIAVVVNGSNLGLYVNGQKIDSMTGITNGGTIGVIITGLKDYSHGEAAFNYAKVWAF